VPKISTAKYATDSVVELKNERVNYAPEGAGNTDEKTGVERGRTFAVQLTA
jgi:hypothetical protein